MDHQQPAKTPPKFPSQSESSGSRSDGFTPQTTSQAGSTKNLSDAAREQVHDLKDAASSLSDDAKRSANGVAESIKNKAREVAEEQKAKGSDQIDGVAQAIRDVADELGKQMPAAAGYVRGAADGVEDFSSSLRNRSVDDLLGSAYRFARTQPLAFFGASVLAGFAVSRFLKSTAERPVDSSWSGKSESFNRPSQLPVRQQGSSRSMPELPTVASSVSASRPTNKNTNTMGSSNAGSL